MSAAVTRSKKPKHETNESSQPAETGSPEKLEARPVMEGTQVTGEPRSISDVGMTPLMHAACDGLAGTVQGLLDRGAEVNAKRSDGFNALALAAFFGHSQVVWLLLENGADLAASGRSETPPETWADVRGFVDIGDILREARATKQVEAPNARTAVIDEPARFARPAEKEEPQRAGDPGPAVEVSVVENTTHYFPER
jgi:ankyrin repeat protein